MPILKPETLKRTLNRFKFKVDVQKKLSTVFETPFPQEKLCALGDLLSKVADTEDWSQLTGDALLNMERICFFGNSLFEGIIDEKGLDLDATDPCFQSPQAAAAHLIEVLSIYHRFEVVKLRNFDFTDEEVSKKLLAGLQRCGDLKYLTLTDVQINDTFYDGLKCDKLKRLIIRVSSEECAKLIEGLPSYRQSIKTTGEFCLSLNYNNPKYMFKFFKDYLNEEEYLERVSVGLNPHFARETDFEEYINRFRYPEQRASVFSVKR